MISFNGTEWIDLDDEIKSGSGSKVNNVYYGSNLVYPDNENIPVPKPIKGYHYYYEFEYDGEYVHDYDEAKFICSNYTNVRIWDSFNSYHDEITADYDFQSISFKYSNRVNFKVKILSKLPIIDYGEEYNNDIYCSNPESTDHVYSKLHGKLYRPKSMQMVTLNFFDLYYNPYDYNSKKALQAFYELSKLNMPYAKIKTDVFINTTISNVKIRNCDYKRSSNGGTPYALKYQDKYGPLIEVFEHTGTNHYITSKVLHSLTDEKTLPIYSSSDYLHGNIELGIFDKIKKQFTINNSNFNNYTFGNARPVFDDNNIFAFNSTVEDLETHTDYNLTGSNHLIINEDEPIYQFIMLDHTNSFTYMLYYDPGKTYISGSWYPGNRSYDFGGFLNKNLENPDDTRPDLTRALLRGHFIKTYKIPRDILTESNSNDNCRIEAAKLANGFPIEPHYIERISYNGNSKTRTNAEDISEKNTIDHQYLFDKNFERLNRDYKQLGKSGPYLVFKHNPNSVVEADKEIDSKEWIPFINVGTCTLNLPNVINTSLYGYDITDDKYDYIGNRQYIIRYSSHGFNTSTCLTAVMEKK